MKRLLILLFLPVLFSCKPAPSKVKLNPEAVKLNNRALTLVYQAGGKESNQILDSAIVLLNKAIQIDSNYARAYYNKFIYQNELKQYDKATMTGKQIIILRPLDPNIKLMLGEDYEKLEDTLRSTSSYHAALDCYNKILDTMKVNNKTYASFLISKAITMIMLNQQKQGYALINEMAAKETDPSIKQMYQQFAQTSRNDWLFWNVKKDATISEDPVSQHK